MATKQSTVDFILEQLEQLENVRARKMFGEFAIYCNEKVVALVCDDQLFLKPTIPGREFLEAKLEEAPPYPGAKNYFLISGDYWDNKNWLSELTQKTADALPVPKPKKLKS